MFNTLLATLSGNTRPATPGTPALSGILHVLAPLVAAAMACASLPAQAQYDAMSAPRLLSEYRNQLENLDSVTRALDKNVALAKSLQQDKKTLDSESADLDEQSRQLKEEGDRHNAEVADFNAQCIDVQVTDQATGDKCNRWSAQLNARNEDLSARGRALSGKIDALNARVKAFNEKETARANEAAELDRRYDEIEADIGRIESRLASMPDTSDYVRRCNGYQEPETRQKCMQQFYNEEH